MGRLHARPSPPNTEPILQHRHPRNIPSLRVFGPFNIMSEIDSFHKLLFQVWVTLDLIWYCTKVCLEICDYLEVNLFTIPFNDPSSGSGSSHSSAGSPASNGSSASSGPVTRGRKKHSLVLICASLGINFLNLMKHAFPGASRLHRHRKPGNRHRSRSGGALYGCPRGRA